MSAGNFKQLVANKMMANLNRTSQKVFNQASRIVAESKAVQNCLVANKKAMDQFQVGFRAGVAPTEVSSEVMKKHRRELKGFIRRNSKTPPKELTEGLYASILKARRLRFGTTVFYTGVTFETIKDRIATFHDEFARKELNVEFDRKAFASVTHFDHGADGPGAGTFNAATFGVATALGSGIDKTKLMSTVKRNLEAVVAEEYRGQAGVQISKRLYELIGSFEQLINPDGTLKAGASFFITALDAKGNIDRGATLEKDEVNMILKAVEMSVQEHLSADEYLNFVGSSTLKDKMSKVVVEKFADNIVAGKNIKKKVNITTNIKGAKLKTSTKTDGDKSVQVKSKIKTPKTPKGKKAVVLPGGKGPRRDRAQLSKVSLQSFLAILNSQIQKQVAKNMGTPRLENRTGRFLSSVRAIDIQTTARGFPSVGYTYEKRPYQVFEATSGTRFSSQERDPRRLIELSIREIAAQNQIGRLFARRL